MVVSSTTRPSSWEDTPHSSRSRGGQWAVLPTHKSSQGNFSFDQYMLCIELLHLNVKGLTKRHKRCEISFFRSNDVRTPWRIVRDFHFWEFLGNVVSYFQIPWLLSNILWHLSPEQQDCTRNWCTNKRRVRMNFPQRIGFVCQSFLSFSQIP